MNENPLKDIPIEKLKRYCMELGYSLVKRPDPLVPLEPCPVCGRKATVKYGFSFRYQAQYTCPNGCLGGDLAITPDTEPYATKHEVKQQARRYWNDAVERWKNENQAKNEIEK